MATTTEILEQLRGMNADAQERKEKILASERFDAEFPPAGEPDDHGQALDDLEETIEMNSYVMADMLGLDNLREMRRQVGQCMTHFYGAQKAAWDAQKSVYEAAKQRGFKTHEERAFIDEKLRDKDLLQNQWMYLAGIREQLCELITLLDPTDPDLGWDEA